MIKTQRKNKWLRWFQHAVPWAIKFYYLKL
jgi:hypothetical protein